MPRCSLLGPVLVTNWWTAGSSALSAAHSSQEVLAMWHEDWAQHRGSGRVVFCFRSGGEEFADWSDVCMA